MIHYIQIYIIVYMLYIYQLLNLKGCRADPLSEVTRMRLDIFPKINFMHYATNWLLVKSMSRNTAIHCLLILWDFENVRKILSF